MRIRVVGRGLGDEDEDGDGPECRKKSVDAMVG